MDNMNDVTNNIAQNDFSHLPASEAKAAAIDKANQGVSDISAKPSDEQANAFKEFILQH